VHSGKDVPTELPDGLALAGFMVRHSPLDALVSAKGQILDDLPKGAVLGTSSIRRKAFAAYIRPDLKIEDLRGNVDTRLGKLDRGLYDAIILAEAGLDRLGMSGRITERLDPERFLPAVSQGAMALEVRCGDAQMRRLVDPLIDHNTTKAVEAERALLRSLEAGCQVPLGALATMQGDGLLLSASIVAPDGSLRVDGSAKGEPDDPEGLGLRLARELRDKGGEEILRKVRAR
jgi:hydroxymethylbilane synthase